ncbi:MAG: thiolase family protein [Planctomycetaceae bacterium]|nr:thiolase family protein [Planctomycetaceae bacterium]
MTRVMIVAARRTPFGRFRGKLSQYGPVELGMFAARAALDGLDAVRIDSVVVGNVLSAGHGMNVARQIGVQAGVLLSAPAYTVNMMCASGMQAVLLAAQAIRTGESRAVLCGGTESMSQSGLLLPRPPRDAAPNLDAVIDTMQRDGLVDSFSHRHMAETVEDLARESQITREMQDAFALRSQQRYEIAREAGRFRDELAAVGDVTEDEHPRPGTTLESLAGLKPAFGDAGTITAGNASGVNDGAAMLVLADEDFARQQGWRLLAELEAGAVVGCDPQRMGYGPVHALGELCRRQLSHLADYDTLEINEAFAAQTLACLRRMGLSTTDDATPQSCNPDGGAIAVGHPIGASGARLVAHLAWKIARGESQRAAAALCVGGGMGIATALRSS